ncbi:MAG: hypothetical protein EAX95_16460 [Candidatus Thorarchaeota archaeon]|nr:hypothetical protein [Candidatus Thorarchaeota archaeon]
MNSEYVEKTSEHKHDTNSRIAQIIRAWRRVVLLWAVLFILVTFLLFMTGVDSLELGIIGLVSVFIFMTCPSEGKTPRPLDREIRIMEVFISRSESPRETFEKMATKMEESRRVSKDEMRLILQHFSLRDDTIGEAARTMLAEQ